jgi:hypothetical protein
MIASAAVGCNAWLDRSSVIALALDLHRKIVGIAEIELPEVAAHAHSTLHAVGRKGRDGAIRIELRDAETQVVDVRLLGALHARKTDVRIADSEADARRLAKD